ncbi:MAG: glucokinase [Terriglobales bacterium]
MAMILGGDVGGTKCNLALFRKEGSVLRSVFQHRLATRNYAGFEDLVGDFLAQAKNEMATEPSIEAAGFGLAGVVVDGCLHAENLRWALDFSALRRKLNLKNIVFLNDLTATACSLEKLSANDFVILNHGHPGQNATRAVIAAGTGLGQAILVWDGQQYSVAQSEGGQADFAPRTEREIQLLNYLRVQMPHVSCEEIVSGRGFRRIHEFLDPAVQHASFNTPEGDTASEITGRAVEQSCAVCVETLNFWTEMYGAVAGNFALQTLPLGGIYVAGGIAPKILPKLADGSFFQSFCGKSKLASVLERIPVSVVVNEDAPVWGAAYQALSGGESSAILTKSPDH